MDLKNKVAVVTGASRGIGYEITKTFVKRGVRVIAIARNFSDFDLKGDIEKITFDLRKLSDIQSLENKIKDAEILINNAGIMNSLPYDNYPLDKANELMNLNIGAPVELINLISKYMILKKTGRIVNIASVAGQIGHPDVWYGISKAGVINLTKSYAKLLGGNGIVINCIAPSVVDTDMMKLIPEERKDQILKSTLLHRFINRNEVAKTVEWLALDAPEYINGACIDINNGSYFR